MRLLPLAEAAEIPNLMLQAECADLVYQMPIADKRSAGYVEVHKGKKNNKARLSDLENDV
jgi:hypothetical protein